jgi:Leucine-rich repeat (LRR) protein
VAKLLRESALPALSDLDLSGNGLSDAAVDSLLNSSLPPQLVRLILGGNDITDAGAVALAEGWPAGDNDRLETLNLRFTHIGQTGQRALLDRFGGRIDLF